MPATGHTPASENSKPADEHRFDAEVAIKPGETERRTDGSAIQLVRVVLTDNGPVVRKDGTTHHRPDVVCPMRPQDAHDQAKRLTEAGTHAENRSTQPANNQGGTSPSFAQEGRDGANTTALERIERAARRLRSAEAQAEDLRLALEQEIGHTIETTHIPISEMARAAGPSRTVVYDASKRRPNARPHNPTKPDKGQQPS